MASKELQDILHLFPSLPEQDQLPPLLEMRAMYETLAAAATVPSETRCEPFDLDGMSAEWISGEDALEDSATLYLHGGGYVLGSINTHRLLISRISQATKTRALAINYRLAPEDPFPAAVDDAVRAYHWLLEQGIPASRILIAGDSAGGGLTLGTLVALRNSAVTLPAAAACISPWADLRCTAQTMHSKAAVDPLVSQAMLAQMAQAYLGASGLEEPLGSPLLADLKDLPPLLIQVGTSEVLLDDSVELEANARKAGVDVTLEIWEEMFHVWHAFAGMLPEGQEAIDHIGEFARPHLGT